MTYSVARAGSPGSGTTWAVPVEISHVVQGARRSLTGPTVGRRRPGAPRARGARPAPPAGHDGPVDAAAARPLHAQVGAYLAHLRVERGLAANTLAAYARDLARYAAHLGALGRVDLAAVGEGEVGAFAAVLRAGSDGGAALSAASAARAVVAVRGLHRFAAAEGWSAADPAAAVRPPAVGSRLPRALSLDEVEALLAAASRAGLDATGAHGADAGGPAGTTGREAAGAAGRAGAVGLRDRALVELLYGTGARISEVVALDVDDVAALGGAGGEAGEADAEPLLVLTGKGGRQRVVPVGRFAAAAVSAYLVRARPVLGARAAGGGALLLGARGRRLSRQGAWACVSGAARRAGLAAAVGPHTLRHCYATHLVERGADVRLVGELLGHASVATTQVYTAVTAEALREAYATSHPRALRG